MRERFYTTAELARICGVSISTIKRWTDSGLLRCVRTPGGHRKFRLQDVGEAARRLGASTALPEVRPAAEYDALSLLLMQRNHAALAARVAEALARGDEAGVGTWLTELHRHGMPVAEIAGLVLLAAIAKRDAEATDDFTRRRSRRLAEDAARHLCAHLPSPTPGAPKALLAGTGTSGGTLLQALAALVLADLGWERVNLGPGVPLSTLCSGIGTVRPRLVTVICAEGEQTRMAESACATIGAVLCVVPRSEAAAAALETLHERARVLAALDPPAGMPDSAEPEVAAEFLRATRGLFP